MSPSEQTIEHDAAPAADWTINGFSRRASQRWRHAGWTDAADAREWRKACPGAPPAQLLRLHASGYQPDQVQRVRGLTASHVAIWLEVLVGPADGGPPIGADRASDAANLLGDLTSGDRAIVIDLREPDVTTSGAAVADEMLRLQDHAAARG